MITSHRMIAFERRLITFPLPAAAAWSVRSVSLSGGVSMGARSEMQETLRHCTAQRPTLARACLLRDAVVDAAGFEEAWQGGQLKVLSSARYSRTVWLAGI